MPKQTRAPEEIDQVREKILDCAFDILTECGYEGLSMSKIGKRMKMTAANLYNYFTNKDELLIAIHKKAYGMLYDTMQEAVEQANTPSKRYHNMAHAFVAFATTHVNIYDIMFNRRIRQHSDYLGTELEASSYDELRSSLRVLSYATAVVKAYRDSRPELKPADSKYLTLRAIAVLHGIISLRNSGVLGEIAGNPDLALKKIVKYAILSVT